MDIKTEFIKQELEKIGKQIDQDQLRAISKYLHYKTGRLEKGRFFEVKKEDGLDGQLTLTHPIYERFLDIKKKQNVSSNVQNWRNRRRKPRAYPIHNRIIMGNYNRLAFNLMYGFTEEVAAEMKRQLDNQSI